MSFQAKGQSINNHLDKLYSRLLTDGAAVSDWETLARACRLEAGKLSNYAAAIKEEIAGEMSGLPAFAELDQDARRALLASIDRIHEQLHIPEFVLVKEECTEEAASETTAANRASSASPGRPRKSSYVNMGTPIGLAAGLGIGIVLTKSLPLILLGGVAGIVAGSVIGKSAGPGRDAAPPVRQRERAYAGRQTKISLHKFQSVIERRKTMITAMFSRYLAQLEEACRPIL